MRRRDEITGSWIKASDGPKPLVLVAEDDWDARTLYGDFLDLRGFRVVLASDGVDAIARARRHPPDAAVIDLAMPRMSGWEAAAALRAMDATLPIFAITAHSDAASHARARAAGCDRVFVKPVEHRDLARALRSVIANRRPR